MNCILSDINDIYFNLAAEEFLLKQRKNDYFLLWKSQPCVVVGKHQNAFAEINHSYLAENNIPVARRLTGGGTVYHDSGNLNFTFIMSGEKGKLVDYGRYIKPVIEFLHSKNIPARAGIKNEINVNGLKISGNAEHVYKNRVLHHGTLLYNSDIEALKKAIKVKPGIYIDKAVQSNRAEVINIATFLSKESTLKSFMSDLYASVKDYFSDASVSKFSDAELTDIHELSDAKYKTWEWIFGYSPPFEIQKSMDFGADHIELSLKVSNGIIQKATVICESIKDLGTMLSEKLVGKRFDYNSMSKVLKEEMANQGGLGEIILKNVF